MLFRLPGLPLRNYREDFVQQLTDTVAMLGGDGHKVCKSDATIVLGFGFKFHGIDLVHGEENRLAGASEQASEFHIRRGKLSAAIHYHHHSVGLIECHLCLAIDFRRDELTIIRDDAAGIDHAQVSSPPFADSIETIASNSGFIADDRATAADHPVEKS